MEYIVTKNKAVYMGYLQKFERDMSTSKFVKNAYTIGGLPKDTRIILFGKFHEHPDWNEINRRLNAYHKNVYVLQDSSVWKVL